MVKEGNHGLKWRETYWTTTEHSQIALRRTRWAFKSTREQEIQAWTFKMKRALKLKDWWWRYDRHFKASHSDVSSRRLSWLRSCWLWRMSWLLRNDDDVRIRSWNHV